MSRSYPFLLAILLLSCNTGPVSLSPENWADGELEKYLALDSREYPDNPVATGTQGAVTNTFHAAASRAGLEALKQGGSSVDASLTTALTQITLNAGSVTSFFGIMNMVHYDAESGEIVSMDATWNTVQAETDPMSIPGAPVLGGELFQDREVSGRTALVGGLMKGVEAAHTRYGKLPFQEIFQPSIYLAEKGFIMNARTADYFKKRDKQIRRLDETRATLVKPNGEGYQPGDLFQQQALANTLTRIATEGADYMYKGEWAQKLVKAIQADSGKMTMEDLAAYEVIWSDPLKANYGDYDLAVAGYPTNGSPNLIEALNLCFAADLDDRSHWSESGESLRDLSDITNMFLLAYIPDSLRSLVYAGLDLSDSSRMLTSTSEGLWEKMQAGIKLTAPAPKSPGHSDTVVAIDQWGNMTAIVHTINCVIWGNEAIVVDGVSVGDAASFQQAHIAKVGPGNRLPSPIELGIISKNGVPIMPFVSMSMGLHQQTVQSVFNVVGYEMSLPEVIKTPSIFLPVYDYSNPLDPRYTARVMTDAFPDSVLESSGLTIQEIPGSERRYAQGLWVGIYRDPETGEMTAVSPPYATGRALGY